MIALLIGLIMTPAHIAVVETWDGNVYEVGMGDTCADAMIGSVWPDDWREARCEQVWVWR
jgi:hypothetical protein